ncbi:PAS domain S-box protein [Dehalogenimonas sp. 4OHTPN]|uniref:histidine kinase n=1 Tax=Dehalogenimonas sp. 4OHTPN TaxID=3166643 RepID=A0AAU8G8I1_9CHLR
MDLVKPDSAQLLSITYRFLEIANRHTAVSPMLDEFVGELKNVTGCAAVGIRLLDEQGNIPYACYDGFSQGFMDQENLLSIRHDQCMCVNVISGKSTQQKPFYSPKGSFWLNDTRQFLDTVADSEKGTTRNVCANHGYRSVALVPIRASDRVLGLIHVADTKPDMVPIEMVLQLEHTALALGNSITRVTLSQAQRDTEVKFRTLFDNAGDAIILWEKVGAEYQIIEVNQLACDRYGYTKAEMIGMSGRQLNTAASYAGAAASITDLDEHDHARFQLTHLAKSGQEIPVEVTAHNFILNSKPVILSVVRDITDRLKKEAELRQLASFPLSNPNPVLRLTPQGKIVFANPAADLLLKSWKLGIGDVIPSLWLEKTVAAFNTGEKTVSEIKSGDAFFAVTTYPDMTSGFVNLYAMDITARKDAELALQTSRDHLEKLNNSLPDVIFVTRRPSRRIEYVNNRVTQIYGYSAEECLGRTPEFLFATRGAYLGQSRRISDVIRHSNSGDSVRTELMQKRKNGELFPCELIQTFTSHPDGTISIISIARDITSQQQTQKEIESYHQRLEEMVAARTEALNGEITNRKRAENELRSLYEREQTLSAALRQQIEERSLFTRALVHELKTPLTPLLTASDFLEATLTDETARGFARNIKLGARNLEKRINEMLDLARGEVGALRLTYRDFDLVELLTETATYVQPETTRRGQILEINLPPAPLAIQADPDRLRQVVLNLINNSLKFTKKGGHIRVTARSEPGAAVISVEDTGAGIATSDLPFIFQPYHRGQNSDKKRLGGLGLGLALAKMIVELHGGQIWLKSAVGKGSTFNFRVPFKKV